MPYYVLPQPLKTLAESNFGLNLLARINENLTGPPQQIGVAVLEDRVVVGPAPGNMGVIEWSYNEGDAGAKYTVGGGISGVKGARNAVRFQLSDGTNFEVHSTAEGMPNIQYDVIDSAVFEAWRDGFRKAHRERVDDFVHGRNGYRLDWVRKVS